MSKIGKSISIDEDLWFEIRQEAKKQDMTISEYISQKITSTSSASYGTDTPVSDLCSIFNNKYLILNNKLILLENEYTTILRKKIEEKAKEMAELKKKEEEYKKDEIEMYENALKSAENDKVDLEELRKVDMNDGESVSNFWFKKYRGRCKYFNLTSMRIIKNFEAQKHIKKDGK